jgi:hypothetical protein
MQRIARRLLAGRSGLEQYAILLVHVSLGLLFAISGANKLFVAHATSGGRVSLISVMLVNVMLRKIHSIRGDEI